MRAAWVWAMALVLVGCAPGAADQGRTLRVGYPAGSVEHYRYHSSVAGTERTASGGAVAQDRSDVSADAVWRVVSADGRGVLIEQSLANVRPGAASGPMRFTVAPDGLVVPVAAAGGPALPGSAQFLAILADRPVRPGDAWTADVRLAGPTTLRAQSRFERYETWHGRRVAVVSGRSAGPFDLSLRGVRYRGTVDSGSTTWLDPASGQVVRAENAVTTDFTAGAAAGFSGTYRLELEAAG